MAVAAVCSMFFRELGAFGSGQFQTLEQIGNFTPVPDGHGVRELKPAANLACSQSFGQANEHRLFLS